MKDKKEKINHEQSYLATRQSKNIIPFINSFRPRGSCSISNKTISCRTKKTSRNTYFNYYSNYCIGIIFFKIFLSITPILSPFYKNNN